MDEAGRGPVIGPMVIGLVSATPEQIGELARQGVNDSKQLSKSRRDKFRKVIENTTHKSDFLVVEVKEINEMMKSGVNLNEIEVIKYRELLKKHSKEAKELYLDAADVNADRFGKNVAGDLKHVKCVSEHKADEKYTVVGAASIIAKTERDRIVEKLDKEFQRKHPEIPSFKSGYPQQAKVFLEAWYKEFKSFPDIVRTEWKTCKNIEEKFTAKTLDDFF